MKATNDLTRTGLRNLPSSPSVMDRARRQARAHDCAVVYPGPFGHRTAMPNDLATGNLNLEFSGRYDEVEESLKIAGIGFELLEEVAQ